MLNNYREALRNTAVGAVIEKELFAELLNLNRTHEPTSDGSNIAIVGGELFNKGAQAMTFTVVDQLTERHPDKDIYLLSGSDYRRDQEEKEQYEFNFLPWGSEIQLSLLSSTLDNLNTNTYSTAQKERVHDMLSDCAGLVDINGYALSSQQGFSMSFVYLTNIITAKKFDIPMYLFPQSIGPFDYPVPQQQLFNPLLKVYLGYPEIVCPRENAGVEALTPYTRHNVQREFDIVLQHGEYDLDNIYRSEPDLREFDVPPGSVGIVPNSNVFERTNPDEIYELYEQAIEWLLDEGKTMYIFQHAEGDLDHCREIVSRFRDESDVTLIEKELNAIELEGLIEQMDFLIASRYHSIIHAYKNAVPAIVIGWAVKYEELLDEFEQSEFFFEGREDIEQDEFMSSLSKLNKTYATASETIEEKVRGIRKTNLFDLVE